MLCVSISQICQLLSPDTEKKLFSGVQHVLEGCLAVSDFEQIFKRQIDAEGTVQIHAQDILNIS